MPVRWSVVPEQPFDAANPSATGKNYLFDALIADIHAKPLRWHLVITVGQPGDPTADATQTWPPDRQQIDAGTLTINKIESEDSNPIRDINFDPLVLPNGMAPSDDPLLSARLGGLLAVLHPTRRRAQRPQRYFLRTNRKMNMATTKNPTQFALLSRILHWLMAAMLLTMLFIGVSMLSSLANYHKLVAIHRPLGMLILILAVLRLANRLFTTLPPFCPSTMPERGTICSQGI